MRNIPDDNLAYPILINLNTGSSGSGFLLNTETNVYLVTAKHVLFDNGNLRATNATLICQTKDVDDDTTTIIEADLNIIQQSAQLFQHANKDVAAFTIGTLTATPENDGYFLQYINGVSVSQRGNSDIVSVSSANSVKFISEVLVSNDVYLYGYPSSLGLRQSPQFDYTKPLLRKGIVANLYKTFGTIILDCPVYYGNSGGPVVQVLNQGLQFRHHIIGVVSQFVPYSENWVNQSNGLVHTEISNSGYSVAIAMDYVFEMLGLPVNNTVVVVAPTTSNP